MTIVNAPGALASLTTTPSTIAAAETNVLSGKLVAGTLQVGTTIHVAAFGTVSAAAAGTVLARLRAGTAGTTSDTQACATPATGAATTAVGWRFEGYVTVRSTGSGGTLIANGEIAVGANTQQISTQTTTVAINTTIDNFLDFTLIGGGTTPVVTVVQAVIEVVKP
jgi:hypothetical protein